MMDTNILSQNPNSYAGWMRTKSGGNNDPPTQNQMQIPQLQQWEMFDATGKI
jgi:hypothetical protein